MHLQCIRIANALQTHKEFYASASCILALFSFNCFSVSKIDGIVESYKTPLISSKTTEADKNFHIVPNLDQSKPIAKANMLENIKHIDPTRTHQPFEIFFFIIFLISKDSNNAGMPQKSIIKIIVKNISKIIFNSFTYSLNLITGLFIYRKEQSNELKRTCLYSVFTCQKIRRRKRQKTF